MPYRETLAAYTAGCIVAPNSSGHFVSLPSDIAVTKPSGGRWMATVTRTLAVWPRPQEYGGAREMLGNMLIIDK